MSVRRLYFLIGSIALATSITLIPGLACGKFSSVHTKDQSTNFRITDNSNFKVCQSAPTVGRTTIQRLNRTEYNNTLRDLLGIQTRPADAFPPDGSAFSFDNNADALIITRIQAELYLSAAEAAINEAFTLNRTRFMICAQTTVDCMRTILTSFGEKAYRRPLVATEINELAALVTSAQGAGATFEEAIKAAMRGALVSPHFLFRRIAVSNANSPASLANLNAFELASRLSYFLWNSMPDDLLMASAKSGVLTTDAGLEQQVRRMLAHPNAIALVDGFASQWLGLQKIDGLEVNTTQFPEFNANLKADMKTETRMLVQHLLTTNAPVTDLVHANYSYVNSRLATLYGISGVTTTSFQQVSLAGVNRRGVLGHAGFLASAAKSTVPSIVKRGLFVSSSLICDSAPPPVVPPPADVVGTTEQERARARLTNSACAACHQKMDPIGMALNGFDRLGRVQLRDEEGAIIDDRGSLTSGETFKGPTELSNVITSNMRLNVCASKYLVKYALGRGIDESDDCAVSQVAAPVAEKTTMTDMIISLVKSPVFRKQRGGSN